jgi:hypothetical protein
MIRKLIIFAVIFAALTITAGLVSVAVPWLSILLMVAGGVGFPWLFYRWFYQHRRRAGLLFFRLFCEIWYAQDVIAITLYHPRLDAKIATLRGADGS